MWNVGNLHIKSQEREGEERKREEKEREEREGEGRKEEKEREEQQQQAYRKFRVALKNCSAQVFFSDFFEEKGIKRRKIEREEGVKREGGGKGGGEGEREGERKPFFCPSDLFLSVWLRDHHLKGDFPKVIFFFFLFY